jgi:hypothetical protein
MGLKVAIVMHKGAICVTLEVPDARFQEGTAGDSVHLQTVENRLMLRPNAFRFEPLGRPLGVELGHVLAIFAARHRASAKIVDMAILTGQQRDRAGRG